MPIFFYPRCALFDSLRITLKSSLLSSSGKAKLLPEQRGNPNFCQRVVDYGATN